MRGKSTTTTTTTTTTASIAVLEVGFGGALRWGGRHGSGLRVASAGA
jgi:hypothetical protein